MMMPLSPRVAEATERPVAVTGATGFIGREVVRQLVDHGFPVRALVRPAKAGTTPEMTGVEWVSGSLDCAAAMRRLVAGCRTVVNCAGVTRGLSAADFRAVNENGVRQLAAVIRALPAAARPRLLHISSLAAREPHLSPYAASKRRGERVLETEFADLSYTIFRPPAVYGPGDRELRALLRWLCRGILFVPRGVPARLSLLHVSDLAAAVRAWLDSAASATAGCIFTLDDGRPGGYAWEDIRRVGAKLRRLPVVQIAVPRALLQLAAGINTLRTHISSGYRPMLTHGKIRELYHHDWVCDHHALQAACGWQPRIRLIDGLVMLAGSDIGERAPENV